MSQSSLDFFIEDNNRVEDYESDDGGVENIVVELCGCEYSNSIVNGRYFGRYLLHPGAMSLYRAGSGFRALADIDHVYHRCVKGLIYNIRFLYGMFKYFEESGLKVLAIEKAYDDDLYLYLKDSYPENRVRYLEFNVLVFPNLSLERFLQMNNYMQLVDRKIVEEAIGEVFVNMEMGART